jgi:hypothetical protein
MPSVLERAVKDNSSWERTCQKIALRRKLEGTDGMAGWVGTVPTTGLDRFASGQFAPWRDALPSFSR